MKNFLTTPTWSSQMMTIFMIKHSPDNRAVAGCNAPQGSASQESFSGKGTVSGGQSVDLQSQTYDATCKTVAENARTRNSFDAGVDHLPSNSPLTIHTSQKSQQNLLPLSWLATLQPYEDNQEFAVANNKRKKQPPAEKTNKRKSNGCCWSTAVARKTIISRSITQLSSLDWIWILNWTWKPLTKTLKPRSANLPWNGIIWFRKGERNPKQNRSPSSPCEEEVCCTASANDHIMLWALQMVS